MAQHDYIIANQGFPSFRSDLNNGLNAVVTNNSGNSEPSTKYSGLAGITDEEDNLRFDIVFQNGPNEYINWFFNLAERRHQIRNKN